MCWTCEVTELPLLRPLFGDVLELFVAGGVVDAVGVVSVFGGESDTLLELLLADDDNDEPGEPLPPRFEEIFDNIIFPFFWALPQPLPPDVESRAKRAIKLDAASISCIIMMNHNGFGREFGF